MEWCTRPAISQKLATALPFQAALSGVAEPGSISAIEATTKAKQTESYSQYYRATYLSD